MHAALGISDLYRHIIVIVIIIIITIFVIIIIIPTLLLKHIEDGDPRYQYFWDGVETSNLLTCCD